MHYDIKRSGEYIRGLRMQRGYTQGNLAEILNIDRSFLSHIEVGKRGCSVDLFVELSNIFNVSLEELITGQNYYGSLKEESMPRLKKEIRNIIACLETLESSL